MEWSGVARVTCSQLTLEVSGQKTESWLWWSIPIHWLIPQSSYLHSSGLCWTIYTLLRVTVVPVERSDLCSCGEIQTMSMSHIVNFCTIQSKEGSGIIGPLGWDYPLLPTELSRMMIIWLFWPRKRKHFKCLHMWVNTCRSQNGDGKKSAYRGETHYKLSKKHFCCIWDGLEYFLT